MKLEEDKMLISKNLNSISKPKIVLPENGLYEEFYVGAGLRCKGNFINGEKDGLWKEYYENEKINSY